MAYNFGVSKHKPQRHYFMMGLQLLLWILSAANFFYFPKLKFKQPPVTHPKRIVTPQLKPSILVFLSQLGDFKLRLLAVDIYQQDMILKGLSDNETTFHHFLASNLNNTLIVRHELLEWRKKANGTWFFNLRIIFK